MASKIAYFVVFFIGLRFGFNAGKMASVSTTTSSILIAFNVSASHNLFFFFCLNLPLSSVVLSRESCLLFF